MHAWNGWYHVNGNTYGTWLRGDSRGWRARHHREHVNGDYRNTPPVGQYQHHLQHSRRLMKRQAVALSADARRIACSEMAASLVHHATQVIALCVDDHHYHLLARFPSPTSFKPTDFNPWACREDDNVYLAIARHFVGIAKKEAARLLSNRQFVPLGGIWAKRCRILAVRHRAHQLAVYRYICDHALRGAAIWTFRDSTPNQAHGLQSVGLPDEHPP